jgi:hypothetical protein
MTDDRQIKQAANRLKQAAQRLVGAAGMETWEEARPLLMSVATELQAAGDELDRAGR